MANGPWSKANQFSFTSHIVTALMHLQYKGEKDKEGEDFAYSVKEIAEQMEEQGCLHNTANLYNQISTTIRTRLTGIVINKGDCGCSTKRGRPANYYSLSPMVKNILACAMFHPVKAKSYKHTGEQAKRTKAIIKALQALVA